MRSGTSPYRPGTWGISVHGKVGPANGDVLAGSLTQIERNDDIGMTLRRVYRWNLRR
jgi:hypothetical protein